MIEKIGDEYYLVFVVSLVKITLALDEAKLFDPVYLNLELRSDNLDSFSKVKNFDLSVLANIIMVILFLGIMYALFPILRKTVFAINPKIENVNE